MDITARLSSTSLLVIWNYCTVVIQYRGRSRIFKKGGGGGAVEFLDLSFALMLLHTYPVFVRRVVNNIQIVNTACWLKSKYLLIYNENLQKQVLFFFQRGGGAAGRSWIRLCNIYVVKKRNHIYIWNVGRTYLLLIHIPGLMYTFGMH